jgi:hypothetical protein
MVLNFNAACELGCTVLVELSWWLVAHQALSAKIQCAAYYQQVLLCSGFLHFRNFIFTLKDDLWLTLCRSSVLSESDPAFDQYCYSSDFEQLCSSFQVIHFVQHRASKKYLGYVCVQVLLTLNKNLSFIVSDWPCLTCRLYIELSECTQSQ